MKTIIDKLKQKVELLKNDSSLAKIFFLHLFLIGLHFYEFKTNGIEYYWYLRAGGCGLISFCIFFWGRKGLSYSLLIFACSLVYINNFYNYATFFFMLIAIGANPKLKKIVPWIYLINIVISFTLKHLDIIAFLIHIVYVYMFSIKVSYIFKINTPDKLNLTDDEKAILNELLAGKKQKEIELFSQPTITHKLQNARERNMCETTSELLAKYSIKSKSNSNI